MSLTYIISSFTNIHGVIVENRLMARLSYRRPKNSILLSLNDKNGTTIIFLTFFRHEDYLMLMVLMKKLACLSRLDDLVINACDTSFLYWHKLILPVYFEQLFHNKTEAYRLSVCYV